VETQSQLITIIIIIIIIIIWGLWWTKWHWDRFFSGSSVYPVNIIPPQFSILICHL
jgi:hypothetical protein